MPKQSVREGSFDDYYTTLGVDTDATADDIKAAFKSGAKRWHPDVNEAPDAVTRFQAINTAYEVLSDPEKRTLYNVQQGIGFNPERLVHVPGAAPFNPNSFKAGSKEQMYAHYKLRQQARDAHAHSASARAFLFGIPLIFMIFELSRARGRHAPGYVPDPSLDPKTTRKDRGFW